MNRSKEEISKLFSRRISEDTDLNKIFEAFKLYMKHIDNDHGAVVAAVGCIFLLYMTGGKHTSILLAEQGWFAGLDLSMGQNREIHKLLLEGNSSTVDGILTREYSKNLKRIEKKVIAAFPNRKKIIQQAILSHKKKLYYVSVPVLLAQADGIARELTGGEFFQKRDKRPRSATFVDSQIKNPIYSPMFEVLRANLPISTSEQQREGSSPDLNRHAILHGQDIEYGTELNSLKAISLLSYMSALSNLISEAKQPMEMIDQMLSVVSQNQSVPGQGKSISK